MLRTAAASLLMVGTIAVLVGSFLLGFELLIIAAGILLVLLAYDIYKDPL